MKRKRMDKSKGFTLVEILVVLAIIAVLATISYAVFSRVKENGRSTACRSNLEQIALAIQQYMLDSNGRYPPWDRGIIMLPYVKMADQILLFDCPGAPHFEEQDRDDYMYNSQKLTTVMAGQYVGKHETAFPSPASVWLNTDWPTMSTPSQTSYYEVHMRHVSPTVGSPCTFVTWHSGGANFSFLDGHVKWLKPEAACVIDNAS